tara:strand:+ start:3289 stop:3507 length:219 start_codon:yes stop_codon:yes gene_type:complete
MNKQLLEILKSFDLTQLFKGKGDLRRWSSKRTVGGLIVVYALTSMEGEITTNGIIFCCVGILPLCLSFLEKD